MATPAATTIMAAIVARMANITTANGYNVTVQKVALGKLEPFVGYDLPAINVWPTTVSNEPTAYGKDKRELYVMVEIHDYTRDEPFSTVVERLAADVITAVNRATTAPKTSDNENPNLNSTVTGLTLLGYDYQIGKGQKPFCGAMVRFIVKYLTNKNNMTAYGA